VREGTADARLSPAVCYTLELREYYVLKGVAYERKKKPPNIELPFGIWVQRSNRKHAGAARGFFLFVDDVASRLGYAGKPVE